LIKIEAAACSTSVMKEIRVFAVFTLTLFFPFNNIQGQPGTGTTIYQLKATKRTNLSREIILKQGDKVKITVSSGLEFDGRIQQIKKDTIQIQSIFLAIDMIEEVRKRKKLRTVGLILLPVGVLYFYAGSTVQDVSWPTGEMVAGMVMITAGSILISRRRLSGKKWHFKTIPVKNELD